MANCPICKTQTCEGEGKTWPGIDYICDRCGKYTIPNSLHKDILRLQEDNRHGQWSQVISHYIQKQNIIGEFVFLDVELLEKLMKTEAPSFPMEQAENVILWFGDEGLKKQGKKVVPEHWVAMIAIAGAQDLDGLTYIIDNLKKQNLLEIEDKDLGLQLTFKGWERYVGLKRNKSDSKSAFMAMQFNNEKLMDFYKGHLQEAVKASGFKLKTVEPMAGIINDHIMNGIRLARFVIADLTDRNNGAYWEAGFAEGLGKPVFYTCREDKFDGGKGVHFDTNHHRIIPWKDEHDIEAANNLKEAIRNTLPLEAIMEDK